jgi:Holliday junction resolvasome RuvABC DNA-binding subunit
LEVKADFASDSKPESKPESKPASKPVEEPEEDCEHKEAIYRDMIPALERLGFRKKEAKSLIDKHYTEGVLLEDLVGEILRGVKDGNCITV